MLRRFLVWSCACGALLLASPTAQPARPNVLLITIDTLRADRLGGYGYRPARTPVLDGLAAAGVRFADATAHAPLTYPSHAAILTGRYPGALGVRLNGMDPLPAAVTTLAEALNREGYRTGAVVGSVILDRATGLAQGFDDYDDRLPVRTSGTVALSEMQRPADQVTAGARRWLSGQSGPWFLWAHYYDPHLPYAAPTPLAAPADAYDAEVAFTDRQIGVLLEAVDQSRTIVVVTSDHGEALGDHGESDHGFFVYDATLQVPLIVAGPRIAPRVVSEQVRGIDVTPTIVQLAGASVSGFQGESLVPLIEGRTRADVPVSIAESWYPRLHFGWSELRAIRVGEWKYIAAPKPELYDLRRDKAELRNVVADRANVAARLAADLMKATAGFGHTAAAPAEQPDAATVERLQALGYVGAFAPVTTTTATENPKDRIGDYRHYRDSFNRALTLLGGNRAKEAVPLLQRLVKMNVRAFEAHLYLGNAYAAVSRFEAALGEYDAAAQLNPGLATPHVEAAKVLSAMNRHDAAAARARKGLAIDPRSAYAHYTLGVVHQKAGQWPEAAAAFAQAVELAPQDPRAHANLASALMRLGDPARASTHFEQMIALGYQVAPAQFNLGFIAARRGDREEALRRYKLALAADPSFAPARDALAKMK